MRIPENLYSAEPSDRRRSKKRFSLHWQETWRQWMAKRLPAAHQIKLNRKNIFIFPTKAGMGFMGLILILLLVGINFESSPAYALTFLLGGVFTVSILHTYSNLSGLILSGNHAEPAFAGRDAVFTVSLKKTSRSNCYGLQLSWQNNHSEWVDLYKSSESKVTLRYRTGLRGRCYPGRLKVESRYPLGILKAWTWVDLKMQTLIYPHPIGEKNMPSTGAVRHSEGRLEQVGSDDYHALRTYQPGDSMRSVAWKHYAKSGVLNTKQFVDCFDQRIWLDWESTQGSEEQRLSQLCYWALQSEVGSNEYGLCLPGGDISPARGRAHLENILANLALYNNGAETHKNSETSSNTNVVQPASSL